MTVSPEASQPGPEPEPQEDSRFAASRETPSGSPEDATLPARQADTIINEGAQQARFNQVETIWGNSIRADASEEMTIKAEGTYSSASRCVLKPRSLVDATMDGPQKLAADYQLLEVLGEGGMGVVYEAHQASVDRSIAVKMLKPGTTGEEQARIQFLAEAAVTGDLDHPNIVPIHDLGVAENGALFYAMKRVQGTPWKDVIGERSVAENLETLLRVCDAIAFAHSRNVIHRDLKPENIMLGDYGEVLVMDWGLAVSVGGVGKAEPLSERCAIGGTPAYMAPEMALGKTEYIGKTSDIYLLGAILYQIVNGRPPHTGETTMHCVLAAANNDILPPTQQGELMDIAARAMATAPIDRYGTVQAFQEAIREYQQHAESIDLATRAMETLAAARQSRDYDAFAQSLYRFREAAGLWAGNEEAQTGIWVAQLDYAGAALEKGDLDLAASLLDSENPAHAPLAQKVAEAQMQAQARRRRLKVLVATVICLAALIFLAVTVGLVLVRQQKLRAESAERQTRTALTEVQRQKEQTEVERNRAEKERNRALAAEAKAAAIHAEAEKALALLLREKARSVVQQRWTTASEEKLQKLQATLGTRAKARAAPNQVTFSAAEAGTRQKDAATALGRPVRLEVPLGNDTTLALRLVPAGAYTIGSPVLEEGREALEFLHRVELSQPFYLGETEITRGQWEAVTGSPLAADKSSLTSPTLAAVGIDWLTLRRVFLPALQAHLPPGLQARLPTEAEWEVACRAGTGTAYAAGSTPAQLQKAAWFNANSNRRLHPVGEKQPNAWGFYDMHGNVAEWCMDRYEEELYLTAPPVDPKAEPGEKPARICIRGGSWINLPQHCRSAYRSWTRPDSRYAFLGFRVAVTVAD